MNAVFSTEFYLLLYFQAVKSASPLESGYRIIPTSSCRTPSAQTSAKDCSCNSYSWIDQKPLNEFRSSRGIRHFLKWGGCSEMQTT